MRLVNFIILLLMFMGIQVYGAPLPPSATIRALKANQHGILLMAPAKPRQVIAGEKCVLEIIGKRSSPVSSVGSRYVFKEHGVPAGSLDEVIYWSATFRNMWANPHVLILRCNTPRDFSLTLGEIEKDLSHTIRFY